MARNKVLGLLLCVLICSNSAYAQKFVWDVDFKFGLDNREYAGMELGAPSFTTFGAVFVPKVGLSFGEGHSLMIGADAERYFGQANPKMRIDPMLYYQFEGPHLQAYAGAFPKKKLAGDYPLAFFDDMSYFDPVVEGTLLRYTGNTWLLEATVDWLSCYDKNKRERFAVYSYGRKDFKFFRLGYFMLMHHFSVSGTLKNVVDDIWLYPFAALEFGNMTPLSKLGLRVGWIQTFQNDRINNTGYVYPGGFQGEFTIEKWGVGISETIYLGKNLHPFYSTLDSEGNPYGGELYFGSRFYGVDSGIYNRLEAYYAPNIGRFLTLKASFVVQYDGYKWGTQQLVRLIVNLNNLQFPKKTACDNG